MMLHLLKIEWLKVKNYKDLLDLGNSIPCKHLRHELYWYYYLKQGISQGSARPISFIGNPYDFPNVWHTVADCSSCFIISRVDDHHLLTNEFNFKTHRQNIIDGWSRSEFINIKIVLIVIISLLATLFVF